MSKLLENLSSGKPILINPKVAEAYARKISGISPSSFNPDFLTAMFGKKPVFEKFPPYAFIPVKGVIGKGLTPLESMCDSCDLDDVYDMLCDCEYDDDIETVIMVYDTPGGGCVGVEEIARKIKNFKKETISFTAKDCCSAGYWMASQAKKFYATPSSTVGSIGCYIAYVDSAKAWDMEGFKMEVIKSGLFKGTGINGTSLDSNQRKMLQDEVNEIHMNFKADVKSVRTMVDDSCMEGQTFSGKKAAEMYMVTGLVDCLYDLLYDLDENLAKQYKADEENDERHDLAGKAKAKAKAKIKSTAKKDDDEDEEDEEEDEEDMKKKGEDDPSKRTPEDEDEDGEDAVDTDKDYKK